MERMLGHVFAQPVELTCAGRTDAGVHARGQVAHLDIATWPDDVDLSRINRAMPDDIRVTAIAPAPRGFDARFSAIWREYTYRVMDGPVGPAPLERHTILPWPRLLDIDSMNSAAEALLGEHDFTPYCKQREFASSVRELKVLRWDRDASGAAVMTVRADAFCHSMVRSLVGVMLPVGDGRRPVAWPAEVLARGVRDSAVAVMPAHPLVLELVGYPPDDQLLERQSLTRTFRVLGQSGTSDSAGSD
jgi:tRNA pseudouridine38-40 synthase